MTYTVAQLIEYLDGMVTNADALSLTERNYPIHAIAPLSSAGVSELAFLSDNRHVNELANTLAGGVLVTEQMQTQCPSEAVKLVVASPYLAYAKLSGLFAYQPKVYPSRDERIHPTAIIAPTVKLGQQVRIGAYCVIGDNVEIGDYSVLESHVTLGDGVIIGESCQLKAHVFMGHHCQLGDFVTLHSHASIGNEGFGFAPRGMTDSAGWQKIHQLGRVVIGNHVRVGSHTCIDRGALDDTVIGDNVVIDNLVQIAHNVQVGAGTAIAANSGIAGSTHIGKRCIIAGAVGITGHIKIADDVTITGMSMVTKSLTEAGSYSSGMPVMPSNVWRRAVGKFRQLVKDK